MEGQGYAARTRRVGGGSGGGHGGSPVSCSLLLRRGRQSRWGTTGQGLTRRLARVKVPFLLSLSLFFSRKHFFLVNSWYYRLLPPSLKENHYTMYLGQTLPM